MLIGSRNPVSSPVYGVCRAIVLFLAHRRDFAGWVVLCSILFLLALIHACTASWRCETLLAWTVDRKVSYKYGWVPMMSPLFSSSVYLEVTLFHNNIRHSALNNSRDKTTVYNDATTDCSSGGTVRFRYVIL